MADLSILDTTGNAELTLKHPGTGADLDSVLVLPSCDSKRYADIMTELSAAGDKATVKQWQKELVSKAIISWKNVELDGESLDYNVANTGVLLTRCPWIVDQAFEFMTTRANFLTKPQKDF